MVVSELSVVSIVSNSKPNSLGDGQNIQSIAFEVPPHGHCCNTRTVRILEAFVRDLGGYPNNSYIVKSSSPDSWTTAYCIEIYVEKSSYSAVKIQDGPSLNTFCR